MHTKGRIQRRKTSALVALGVTALALIVTPAGWAHSVLVGTEPPRDGVVAVSPERVELRFDEPVETALGSIRVYDGFGERVDAGEIDRPRPESVSVAIDGELADGTYTATWRVISGDSDPISGAFVFHVGAPGAQPGGIAADVAQKTPSLVSFLYVGVRFLDYALLLLCAGGALILAFVLPMAAQDSRPRLYRALAALAGLLLLVALAGLVLQGAYGGGFGLRQALEWDVLSAVAGTRFGEMALVRAGLAATLAAIAFVLSRRERGRLLGIGCVLLAAGLLVTPAASGHASVAGRLAFVADYAHLLAASAWTGGLAFLFAGLLLARTDRWSIASRAVPRFSQLAVLSVGLLIGAGVVNGYLQVKTWRGLWDTEYGVLLMVKVGLVLPLLGLGAFNNRYAVPRLKSGMASVGERRRFLRAVGAELTVMTAIVGVTAVLVNAAPAYKLVAMHSGPMAEAFGIGPYEAHATVSPARGGPNQITLDLQGHEPPDEVVVFATLASERIGPLRYIARKNEHGRFVVPDAQLSIPGDWDLRFEVRKGEFDLYTETISVRIEEAR